MSNPIAYWDIGLDIECPACKEWVDLLRTDDFWEGRSFNPIEHHTHRMLGASQHERGIGKFPALKTAHRRRTQLGNQFGGIAKAFVSAAPALVLGHRNAGGKGPANTRARHFQGRDVFGLLHQGRIVRRAQPNVVREDDRAIHVVVAVNRVYSIKQWNLQARFQSPRLVIIHDLPPYLRHVVGRPASAAIQNGTETRFSNVGRLLEGMHVRLHHLPNFFIERHLGHRDSTVRRRPVRLEPA